MKLISYENLEYNNIYYINHNGIKYIGIFNDLYNYDYFSIVLFKNVFNVNSFDKSKTTKNFIIGSYYNTVEFYIPELEQLLLEQILRQKINDDLLAKIISKKLL